MSLVDPTSGAGYAFGAKLPATHMTTIATNQPKAVDGNGGGTYTPSGTIIVNGSGLQLGNKLKYTSRTVTRRQPAIPITEAGSTNWRWFSTGTDLVWQNQTLNTSFEMELERLAHNSVLSDVKVYFQAASGHMGTLPNTMPTFAVYSIDLNGTRTLLGSVTSDPSASAAVFETNHAVTVNLGAGPHTIDLTTTRYLLKVVAENGGSAVTGARVWGVVASMTVTEQSEV